MKLLIKIFLLLSVLAGSAFANEPIPVKMGVYIISLGEISPNGGIFDADFWLWFSYKDKSLNMLKSREFINAKQSTSVISDTEVKNTIKWQTEKIKGIFKHDYDTSRFPFDRHELKIVIEESIKESDSLIFEPDLDNSKFDPAVSIDGWNIKGFNIKADTHTYLTNFGNPSTTEGTSYGRITASIVIEREPWGIFTKVIMAVYIAMAIVFLAFFMKTSSADIFSGRIGLMVSMLFVVVINKQIMASMIGQEGSSNIVEKIHILSYAFIFISIAATLFSRKLSEISKESFAAHIDHIISGILLLLYCVLNGAFLMRALS